MAGEGGRIAGAEGCRTDAGNRGQPEIWSVVRGLADATTTHFVDETQQRTIFINMVDRIVLQHEPVAQSVSEAAAQDQKVLNGKD